MKYIIQISTDKNGNVYLDLNNFKELVDVDKVSKYSLEEVDDDGDIALILKFYDKNGNVLSLKNDTPTNNQERVYYNPKTNTIGIGINYTSNNKPFLITSDKKVSIIWSFVIIGIKIGYYWEIYERKINVRICFA